MKQTTRRNRQRRNTTRRQRQRRNTTRRQRQRKNNKRVKKGGSGGGGGGGGEGGGEGGAPPIDNFTVLQNIIMKDLIKDEQLKATLITQWRDNKLINEDQQLKLIALLNQ